MNQIKEKINIIKDNLSSLNQELDSLCDSDVKNCKYIDNLSRRIMNLDIEIDRLKRTTRFYVGFISFTLIIVLCSFIYGNINTNIYGIIVFILMIQIVTMLVYE